jgi:hypothetical protein
MYANAIENDVLSYTTTTEEIHLPLHKMGWQTKLQGDSEIKMLTSFLTL